MQTTMDLSGLWEVRLGDGAPATVHLPGTLEENGLGEPETPALESRLTRRFRWEGEAVFSREVTLPDHPGRRLILEAERARQLRLTVDGQPVPTLQGTLSTPYLFELTRWAGRRVRLCLLSDNRYPGWPREEIVHASAATDETQTNWNGLLGRLCVHSVADFWVRSVRVYPHGRTLDAAVDLAVPRQALDAVGDGELVLEGPALARPFCLLRRDWQPESLRQGLCTLWCRDLPVAPEAPLWEEACGALTQITASLVLDGRTVSRARADFGLRTFGADGGRLTLNGRVFLLRGEANCCVFPETGHPPMTTGAWREVLGRYRAYGVNCLRFHSWCPPEAAFAAADELGMLLQPELSDWNCTNALETPHSAAYYEAELRQILFCYAKESLKKFNALFTLRYSATHKEKYDMVYRLDAMDAYNQHLVKKIAALGITLTGTTATNSFVYVEGVDIYKNKAPTARLGFEIKGKTGTRTMVRKVQGGDDLYTLSGELDEYADRFVILPDGIDGRDNSVTFLNGLKLYAGQISGNEQMTALQRRIQIRETIRTHIQRERELYPRGIKVLSLFFIDEVSKYRLYDGDNDDGRNGEYAKMFEEEYENVVGQMQRQFGDDAYLHYLDGIDVHKTHQGYFSIDKKKGKKARFVEGKIDRKTQLSDDVDAYDLIMKDKERLLSLDEPVRFIFSHSALREGWDNPNVFQICTLKPQSESEIRSRQEIGRGLRLCVNQQGERMDESVLGRDVQELNKLTLITDLEYGKFAEALQTGLAESLADRPQKVDTQLFVGRTLVDANGEQVHVTQDLANAIYEDLIQNDYVKRGKLTDKYFADKEIGSFHVASEVSGYADSVVRILSGVYDAHTMAPENAHSNNVQAIVDEEKLHKH